MGKKSEKISNKKENAVDGSELKSKKERRTADHVVYVPYFAPKLSNTVLAEFIGLGNDFEIEGYIYFT